METNTPEENKQLLIFVNTLICSKVESYRGFCSIKGLAVLLLLPGWDASPSQGYPPPVNLPVPIYTWVERGTVRVISSPKTKRSTLARAQTWAVRLGVERAYH